MKNPNGYGSVYMLSGNRRNPWTARITVGFKDIEATGKSYPIYKFLGYYKTRKEALTALALYNSNPEAVTVVDNTITPTNKITLQRVYDEWSEEHYKRIKTARVYTSAYKIFTPLYDRSLPSIKIAEYEELFESSGKNRPVLYNAKGMLKMMYEYAFRKGYITQAEVETPTYISLEYASSGKRDGLRVAFKKEEIAKLWKDKDSTDTQVVLFMIYSGLRISETAALRPKDVHLKERYFDVIESKTEAGVRKVPIAKKIMPIVEAWLKSGNEYVVPMRSEKISVRKLPHRNGFNDVMQRLGVKHTQHDTRHTLATLLTEAEVDWRFVELIMGHKFKDVTNRVYANKVDISVLIEAIDKIEV